MRLRGQCEVRTVLRDVVVMDRQEKSDSWFVGRNFWSSISSTFFELLCLLSILAAHSPTVDGVEADSGSPVTKWSDVCKWDTFSAECPSDSVILVDHAFYGRMRLGTCLTVSYGHIGCSADVRSIVERRCSGRRHCSVQVPDVELDKSAHNCPPDLGAYLEIGFHCQPVITGSDQNCSSNNPLSIPSNGGVLASIVTMETGRGSISCPWVIKTTAGQTLTVTLLDFTGTSTAGNSSTGVQDVQATATGDTYVDVGHVCVIYAEIKERIGGGGEGTATEQLRRVALVCGGERRTKVVYTSSVTTSSELFVNVYATSAAAVVNNPTYFLIKFEVGCVEYVSANTALTVVRSTAGQSVQVQCVGDNRTRWDVACVDGRWTPDMSGTDCSRPLHTALLDSAAGGATSGQLTANQGVLIIIVIGTALLLSIIIIVAGIVYLRRKSRYEVGAVTDVVDPYGKYAFPADASSVYAFVHTGCGGVGGGAQREFYPAMLASHERLSVGERDYATTLQMRQTATPTPPCPLDAQPHHIQALWTCPVHGHVVRLIPGAVPPPPPPRCVAGFDGGRIYETTARLEQAPAETSSGSPFYHELDPNAVVMTTDRTRRAAAAATSVGNGANCAAADDGESTPKQPPDSSR